MTTDWSKENITGVLSQVQNGQERFLGCWGRKCNQFERNYPSYKGELLAVIKCIKKWKHILSYQPFEVHTDASTLKYLTSMKNQSGLFTRWYQERAGFNFTVIHKEGKENSNPDALSRSSHLLEAPPLYKIDKPVIQFAEGGNEIQHVQHSIVEVAEEHAKGEVWREVISWVEQGCVPDKKETRGKAREVLVAISMFDPEVFKMKNGVLMITKAANRNQKKEVWQICLPKSTVKEVRSLCHQSNLGRHRGVNAPN